MVVRTGSSVWTRDSCRPRQRTTRPPRHGAAAPPRFQQRKLNRGADRTTLITQADMSGEHMRRGLSLMNESNFLDAEDIAAETLCVPS